MTTVEEKLLETKVKRATTRKFKELFEPVAPFSLKKPSIATRVTVVVKEDIPFRHPTNGIAATLVAGTRVSMLLVPKPYGKLEAVSVLCNAEQDCVMTYDKNDCWYYNPVFSSVAEAVLGVVGILLQRAASLDYKDRKPFSLERAFPYYAVRGITVEEVPADE